ncbi:MAG TPA: hypothetical protein VF839_08225 [Clostridium sp.]
MIREIESLAVLTSTSTVHGYIKRLEVKGFIYKSDNSSRIIMIK